jgi:MFS transporter, DHA2 family, multidrug resistance protein
MSVGTKTQFGSGTGAAASGTNRWLIAVIVSIATFMAVLDTTIANAALRYISGGLAIGPSQVALVVTSDLVANSIALCASSLLFGAFGRRNFSTESLQTFRFSPTLFSLRGGYFCTSGSLRARPRVGAVLMRERWNVRAS